MIVLGISTNSRVLGIAILDENILLDYNVHYYKESWSGTKPYRILGCLNQYHKRYPISSIAIAIPYEYYQNKETKALIRHITKHYSKKKILVTSYQPEALHYLHQETKAKKKAMMECLTGYYPELRLIHKKELRNKRRYYFKLFEAVAVARLLNIENSTGKEVA
jgi:hypothetical protein